MTGLERATGIRMMARIAMAKAVVSRTTMARAAGRAKVVIIAVIVGERAEGRARS